MSDPDVVIRHPLESIADIRYGFTAKACFEPVGPKFLRITDIQDGIVDWDSVPYCEAPKKDFEKFQLSPGEIVFARTGATTGKSYLIKDEVDAVFASYLIRVKPVSERIFPQYLAYYFQTDDYWADINAGTEGAAQGGFNASKLGQLRVPLPRVEEQKRIVAVLDQAFAAIDRARAHAEANLADAQALFTSFVTSKFSGRNEWRSEELGSRIKFVDYRGKTPPKSETGIRLITAKNVRMGFVKEDPREFVPEDAYKGWMTRGIPRVGDVLFTTEAPLANVAQLETDERVVIGQRLITMQTNPTEIDSGFLKWSLISSQMQSDIHSQGTGATVLGIKASLLKKILLHLPESVGLQKQIASECEAAFASKIRLEKQYSAKLTDLANLRQSLLQKAFSGELT